MTNAVDQNLSDDSIESTEMNLDALASNVERQAAVVDRLKAYYREQASPIAPSTDDEVDQLGAFRETVAFAEERGMPDDPDSDLGLDHLRRMLDKVEHGVATFSPGKLGRWLGWVQAAVVAAKVGTLDDMKAINNRHKIVR